MAVVYIAEYANIATPFNEPANALQTVAITAGSVASAAFQNNTNLVRVHTDAICSVAFGAAPTATATTTRLAANQTESFRVPMGAAFKVAVITNT